MARERSVSPQQDDKMSTRDNEVISNHSRRRRDSDSRSPSPRSRARSRSRDRYSGYSDYSGESFYSGYSPEPKRKSPAKTAESRNVNSTASHAYTGTGRGKKRMAGGKKGAPGRNSKAAQPISPRQLDYVTKRMLSARRIKINELRNELEMLNTQVEDLKLENKTLKRDQCLREKALDKYTSEESDMANLMKKHSTELRVVKDSSRKLKDKNKALERQLRETTEELESARKSLKKMKALAEDKELGERDELARRLSKAESMLDEKDQRVRDLDRHVDNLSKNHKHEMGIERARHKETQKKLHDLEEQMDAMREKLREREKELEVRNIYTARAAAAAKPPHHLNNSFSGSAGGGGGRDLRERNNSDPSLTAREKARENAKALEQQRREENKRKREERERREAESRRQREEEERVERERRERQEREEREERERLEREEREAREQQERLELEQREWRERKDREREQREEQERRDREDAEARKRREQEEEERKWREERERRKREAEELFGSQKREREEEAERSEREEREHREREDKERRAREQSRFENDAEDTERQRKKQELLARMRAIDAEKSKAEKDADLFSLSKDKTVTKETQDSFLSSSAKQRKDYNFTKPVENMHKGKPAYEANGERSRHRKTLSLFDDDSDDGGYNPSFGRTAEQSSKRSGPQIESPTTQGGSKKKDLMSELFGSSGSTGTAVAASSTPKKTAELDFNFTSTGSPNKKPTTRLRGGGGTEGFGSGLGFGGDEAPPHSNSGLLPRRMKQPTTTIHNRPTVNAVDSFEDELEEVIL